MAAAQPYGLTALRFRGIRYWWAGIGLAVLGLLYVGPIAAALQQPSLPTQTATVPLPGLSIPAISFPLFKTPNVHAVAPLAPVASSPQQCL